MSSPEGNKPGIQEKGSDLPKAGQEATIFKGVDPIKLDALKTLADRSAATGRANIGLGRI